MWRKNRRADAGPKDTTVGRNTVTIPGPPRALPFTVDDPTWSAWKSGAAFGNLGIAPATMRKWYDDLSEGSIHRAMLTPWGRATFDSVTGRWILVWCKDRKSERLFADEASIPGGLRKLTWNYPLIVLVSLVTVAVCGFLLNAGMNGSITVVGSYMMSLMFIMFVPGFLWDAGLFENERVYVDSPLTRASFWLARNDAISDQVIRLRSGDGDTASVVLGLLSLSVNDCSTFDEVLGEHVLFAVRRLNRGGHLRGDLTEVAPLVDVMIEVNVLRAGTSWDGEALDALTEGLNSVATESMSAARRPLEVLRDRLISERREASRVITIDRKALGKNGKSTES